MTKSVFNTLLWRLITLRWSRGAILTAYFVLQRAATNVLLILTTTLFLARAGVGRLPLMYILMNGVAIVIQVIGVAYPRLSSYRLLRRMSNAMIAAMVSAPVFLLKGTPTVAIVCVFTIQILTRVFEIMSGALFLNMINEIYPLREAKEHIPRLLTAASAAVILSGIMVKPVTSKIGVELAIASCGGILVLGQLFLGKINRMLRRVGVRVQGSTASPSAQDEAARVAAEEATGTGETTASAAAAPVSAAQTWSRVTESNLVRSMAAVAFVVSFLKFLQDFQYSVAVSEHFKDQAALAAFLGYYESGATILIITAQAFLTAPMIRRLKLGVVVALLPGVMTISCLVASFWPTLAIIVAAKILYTILSNGFYYPAASLLVGPLEPDVRDRARLVVSTSTSFGCLMVGIALQCGLKEVSAGSAFLWMSALFAVALVMARQLDRSYMRELSDELAGTDAGRRLENVRALRVVAPEYAAARLNELIHDEDASVRERALREVKFLNPRLGQRILQRVLFDDTDKRLQASALREAVAVMPAQALKLSLPHLADTDRRVQSNALEAIAAIGSPEAVIALKPYLDHADHRLRAVATIGLIRAETDSGALEVALGTLAKMARSADPLCRASAAVAMGELQFPFFVDSLLSLAADAETMVFERAVEAIERVRAPDAVPRLLRLSQRTPDPERAARLKSACALLEDRGAQELLVVMEHMSAEERTRLREHLRGIRHSVRGQVLGRALSLESSRARHGVVSYLHRATHSGAAALVDACLAGDSPTIGPALDAMRSGGYRGEGAISRLIAGFLNAENRLLLCGYLREVWERVRATLVLARRWPEESPEESELARRRGRLLAHGFTLVGLLSRRPREVVETLEKALDGDKFIASLSMELVAARIGPAAAADILPLLEELRNMIGESAGAAETAPAGANAPSPEVVQTELDRLMERLGSISPSLVETADEDEAGEDPEWDTEGHDEASAGSDSVRVPVSGTHNRKDGHSEG